MAIASVSYKAIMESHASFRVTTNDGVDADDKEDGMRERVLLNPDISPYDPNNKWISADVGSRDLNPRIFQGFKYGDLPTTYVIGAGEAYAQRQQDTAIDFKDIVDLDKLYPESEYYLNDTTRKWVRKIRRTVLNRQILPVYTSMEGMTKGHHELTIEDMKSITFQVVPSFYWKYDWSYNEFMIHRVGKLASPSKELEMYDMLGNVWEWVRDDWSPSIRALNGKVNPIVGGKEDSKLVKKVIKGGSFDQLLRKVVSSVREDLARNESRSKYATQSNVGFRPSLTFTAENEGGVFVPGETPVDLFFLFDASASQDSEIKTMLHSALKIVDMFSSSDTGKDVCHVGSALFMGNNVRLMCSNQVDTLEQSAWAMIIDGTRYYMQGKPPKNFVPYKYYSYTNMSDCPYDLDKDGYGKFGKLKPDTATEKYSEWIKIETSSSYANISKFSSGIGEDGNRTGLRVKFARYKNNKWMCGEKPESSSRGVVSADLGNQSCPMDVGLDDVDIEQMVWGSEKEVAQTLSYSDAAMMKDSVTPTARDSGGGGGGHSPPPDDGGSSGSGKHPPTYLYSISYNTSFKRWKRHLAVHTGVPTWWEDITDEYKERHPDHANEKTPSEPNVVKHVGPNGHTTYRKVHFGEVPNDGHYDWYFVPDEINKPGWKPENVEEWVNPFSKSFDFFTNDLSGTGISSYSWPFYYSPTAKTQVYRSDTNTMESVFAYKGVLTNMWRGCEPVCAITSKLLKDGYFFSYPWNEGVGYMFRKKPTVKLVFVFTNEYDNAYTASYSYYGGFSFITPVVVPGIQKDSVTFGTKYLEGDE